jgi:hypothetical protein
MGKRSCGNSRGEPLTCATVSSNSVGSTPLAFWIFLLAVNIFPSVRRREWRRRRASRRGRASREVEAPALRVRQERALIP